MSKTLLLVDGSSYLYRAFHALPDLRTRDGLPTGALKGVISMLKRLRKDFKADFSACVFDAKGKTFRDEIYPEYKAHRPPMPDDLAQQIEPLHQAVRALGWPLLMIDGVEADDVIGTLVRQAEREGIESIVSTGDKDLAQLVTPHVRLINTMSNELLDVAGVNAKFGVPPERIVDYLTLIGDTVDNVPGVDKVGPKTAAKWIAEYGSLDALIARAHEVKGVAGENLRKAIDWLPTGRELVTVKTDVDRLPDMHGLHWQDEDRDKLTQLYERFEFKTWLNELLPSPAGAAPVPGMKGGGEGKATDSATTSPSPPAPLPVGEGNKPSHYETVLTEADFGRWLKKLEAAELICLDTETTSLDPMQAKLVGLAFAVDAFEACYLPLEHRYAGVPDQLNLHEVLARLKPILEDARKPKLGQNLKYDWHVLMNHDIQLQGIEHDTLLQSYVLEAHERHDMDTLAARHLHATTIKYEDICGKGASQIGFDQVDIDTATRYSAEDADITLRLHQTLNPQIAGEASLNRVYREIEMPLLPVLARMERTGVKLDSDLL
ncbi:MAG: DNA polymerase I, partial [Hydrogenophilaceae bacterium]|nr:DNA polymerase I [Hydrogenophilaceae bacterium]